MKLKSTMPSFEEGKPAKTEEKEGTWKAEGDSVLITSDGKVTKCGKSGGKLSCEQEKKGEPRLTFVKT
jgi:hypothetical protein